MTQQQPSLVCLGDLLLDVVVEPEAPIERGTDVPGRLAFRRGGSAATTAAAFALIGGRAALITSLGDDAIAGRLMTSLRADGVRVHAARQRGTSARLAAIIDADGERSFITQRGVADQLKPKQVEPRWLRGADVLHVPAYSLFNEPIASAAIHAAGLAQTSGAFVSSDLSSTGPLLAFGVRRSRARLAELGPDVLFANRDEAAALLRRSGRRAWPGLLAQAPLVVVKDGSWGCRVLWRDGAAGSISQLDVAARRIGPVDTTGAGDAFAAGFLHTLVAAGGREAMARPRSLRQAALAGHRVAAAVLRRRRPTIRLG